MCAMILAQYLAHRSQYVVPETTLIIIPMFCLRSLWLSSYLTARGTQASGTICIKAQVSWRFQ